ncbi:MAG: GAF domain-containing protein [Nitrospinae bacterium]|nr:GAF domain-containing protein [Nitrospinota bacterium]
MLTFLGILLFGAVFLLDLSLPLDIAAGMLYIAPVAVSLWVPGKRYLFVSAGTATGFVVLGYFLSPPGGELGAVLVNRSLSITAVWLMAMTCLLQKRTQEVLARKSVYVSLLQDVAIAANEARMLPEAIQIGLDKVCEATGWPVGHAYLFPGDDKSVLEPSNIWHLDNPARFEAFVRVTEGELRRPGVGLPGRALESGKPAWTVDVTRDPNCPRAKRAGDIGVKGGFAFPILVGKEVAGVLEFFSSQAEEPDEALLAVMAHVGAQLGRVFERDRSEKNQRLARENLEKGIEERTAELSRANQSLQSEILEHKRDKEELDRLNRQYDLILASAGEGIFGLDPQGNFTFVNPAAAQALGQAGPEIVGKSLEAVLPGGGAGDDPPAHGQSPIYGALRDHISFREAGDYFRRKDGTLFPADYTCTSSLEDGRIVGAVVTFQNIAERKRAERQREEALADYEHVNNELLEFAYIVSHDLKEPVRGIASLGQWIAEDYAGKFDDAGRQQMQLLLDNARRMHKLIDGILAYSRIGRDKLEKSTLDSGEVVAAVLNSLAIPKNIRVATEGTFPVVLFHLIHLEQVFQNLIGNAVKHLGKPEGEIVVSCRDAGEAWEFCVRDNGVGIPERHFERIFKLFQTLNKSENYADSTGIGLSLVKKILDTHGEEVWVESAVGQGTSFFFTIAKTFAKGPSNNAR